jgi:hypothetical protein
MIFIYAFCTLVIERATPTPIAFFYSEKARFL